MLSYKPVCISWTGVNKEAHINHPTPLPVWALRKFHALLHTTNGKAKNKTALKTFLWWRSTDFNQCRTQCKFKRNPSKELRCAYIFYFCVKTSLQSPGHPQAEGELAVWSPWPSMSCGSARQAGQLLPDNSAHKEHTVWIRIKRTNRIWITHLLLLHEGILSLRDMGSFLEHLAKKSVLPSNY